MIVAAHHSMIGGGKRLPYDAEVEWLQGDGEIYVAVAGAINSVFSAELQIYLTASSPAAAMAGFFGYRAGSSSGCRLKFYKGDLLYGDNVSGASVPVSGNEWLTVGLTRQSMSVNGGEPVTYAPRDGDFSPIYVSATGSGFVASNCRFGPMKIHTGTADYDLLPVRVGSEGRFYDRISQSFIATLGTGAFLYGSDVTQ